MTKTATVGILAVTLLMIGISFDVFPQAEAIRGQGVGTSQYGSSTNICGIEVCSGEKMSMEKKIADYLQNSKQQQEETSLQEQVDTFDEWVLTYQNTSDVSDKVSMIDELINSFQTEKKSTSRAGGITQQFSERSAVSFATKGAGGMGGLIECLNKPLTCSGIGQSNLGAKTPGTGAGVGEPGVYDTNPSAKQSTGKSGLDTGTSTSFSERAAIGATKGSMDSSSAKLQDRGNLGAMQQAAPTFGKPMMKSTPSHMIVSQFSMDSYLLDKKIDVVPLWEARISDMKKLQGATNESIRQNLEAMANSLWTSADNLMGKENSKLNSDQKILLGTISGQLQSLQIGLKNLERSGYSGDVSDLEGAIAKAQASLTSAIDIGASLSFSERAGISLGTKG